MTSDLQSSTIYTPLPFHVKLWTCQEQYIICFYNSEICRDVNSKRLTIEHLFTCEFDWKQNISGGFFSRLPT